ncbi:MAG: hypothetical protein JWO59_708 [Chloroflexi bacterium]|nr:hypothetical protein [Chloroflexota bacterium]
MTPHPTAAYAAWLPPVAWILDEYAELAKLYAERKAAGQLPKRVTRIQPLREEVMQRAA